MIPRKRSVIKWTQKKEEIRDISCEPINSSLTILFRYHDILKMEKLYVPEQATDFFV